MADNFNADDLVRIKDLVKVTGSGNDAKLVRFLDYAGNEMLLVIHQYDSSVAFTDTSDTLKDIEAYIAACKYITANRNPVDDSHREGKHPICQTAEAMFDAYIKATYIETEKMVQSALRHRKSDRKM